MGELLLASAELGGRWPGKDELWDFSTEYLKGLNPMGPIAGWHWAKFIVEINSDRKFIEELARSERRDVRSGAYDVLAQKWPNPTTRRLLEERAVHDEHGYVKQIAKQLAEWLKDRLM